MRETLTSGQQQRRRQPGGPRRWTTADKTAYLAAFATSGQTINAFCEETGVPRATFNLWQREARQRPATSPASGSSGFARVQLTPGPPVHGVTLLVRTPAFEAELRGIDTETAVMVLARLHRATAS
jgi:transposase-like protein